METHPLIDTDAYASVTSVVTGSGEEASGALHDVRIRLWNQGPIEIPVESISDLRIEFPSNSIVHWYSLTEQNFREESISVECEMNSCSIEPLLFRPGYLVQIEFLVAFDGELFTRVDGDIVYANISPSRHFRNRDMSWAIHALIALAALSIIIFIDEKARKIRDRLKSDRKITLYDKVFLYLDVIFGLFRVMMVVILFVSLLFYGAQQSIQYIFDPVPPV